MESAIVPVVVGEPTDDATSSANVDAVDASAPSDGGVVDDAVTVRTTPPPPLLIAPTMLSDQEVGCTSDHSLLIKPIRLKDSTIRTIVDCVRNGTPEVRDLLVTECELIFECRVCRSLHRSLANFIAHKRVYCKEHRCESMPLFEHADDEATVVQPESPSTLTAVAAVATTSTSSPVDETAPSTNDDGYQDESPAATEIFVSPQRIYKPLPLVRKLQDCAVAGDQSSTSNSESTSADEGTAKEHHGSSAASTKRRPVRDFFDGILRHLRDRSERRAAQTIPVVTLSNIDGNPNAVLQSIHGPGHVFISDCSDNDHHHHHQTIQGRDSVETIKTEISMDFCDAVAGSSQLPSPPDSPLLMKPSLTPPPAASLPLPRLPTLFATHHGHHHPLVVDRQPTKITSSGASLLASSKAKPSNKISRMVDGKILSVPCIKCRTLFSSIKTLIVHLKSVHSKTRVYFMCIFCSNTFANSWAVGRHIMRAHKRSKLQVANLKERIQQKAFQNVLDDVSTSDELDTEEPVPRRKRDERLRMAAAARSTKSNSRSRDLRNKRSARHRCGSCVKTFIDRRSLARHEKSCAGGSNRSVRGSANRMTQPRKGSPNKSIKKRIIIQDQSTSKVAGGSGTHKSRRFSSRHRVSATQSSPLQSTPSLSLAEIKSLQCDKCGIKFSNLSNCRRHVAKHIGLNRYKCKYCEYQSYHRYNVCYHMQSAHPEEVAGKSRLAIKNSLVDVEQTASPTSTPPSSHQSDNNSVYHSGGGGAAAARIASKVIKTERRETITMASRRKMSAPKKNGATSPAAENVSDSLMADADLSPRVKLINATPIVAPVVRRTSTISTGFNISTRRNPRVFDTTPYRRDDRDDEPSDDNRSTKQPMKKLLIETRSSRFVKEEPSSSTRRKVVQGTATKDQKVVILSGEQAVNGLSTGTTDWMTVAATTMAE